MRTIVVLFAVVACALAGPGGPGGFKFPHFPQSCIDGAETAKKCFEGQLQGKVDIKIEEVKKCFESCPHTKGEGKGEGKGEHPKSKDSSAKGGNWEQFKESFKAVRECMDGKIGDKMEQCVKAKITFAVAAPKESKGGPGGRHGKGGRGGHGGFRGGNPLKTLKEKAEKCGVQSCVQAALGQWYEKTDELSSILCEASKACKPSSDQCKTDLKAGKQAACDCHESLKTELEAAKAECTPKDASDAIDRVAKRAGKGKGERHGPCDDDSSEEDNDSHERSPPFCDA